MCVVNVLYGHHYSTIVVMATTHFQSPDPRNIRMFVLDEADEMLSRGFKDQIYDVFRKLESNIQVLYIHIQVYTYHHTDEYSVGVFVM